jgi:hypothetical protein
VNALLKSHLKLKSRLAIPGLSALCVCLSGCERSPSVDVFGSYFPVWFFCILVGLALMLITRYILIRTRLDQEIGPLAVIYPCLTALFSFILWYIFFP